MTYPAKQIDKMCAEIERGGTVIPGRYLGIIGRSRNIPLTTAPISA
jgi:hypothetical protein